MAHAGTARARRKRSSRRRVRTLRIDHLADVIRVQNGAANKDIAYASYSAGDKVIWVSDDSGKHTIVFDFPEGSPFDGADEYTLHGKSWVESDPISGSATQNKTYRYHINSTRLAAMSDPGVHIDP